MSPQARLLFAAAIVTLQGCGGPPEPAAPAEPEPTGPPPEAWVPNSELPEAGEADASDADAEGDQVNAGGEAE